MVSEIVSAVQIRRFAEPFIYDGVRAAGNTSYAQRAHAQCTVCVQSVQMEKL